ncbi:type II secretion system F family protein [Parasphingopyxis sp. CP4]|uniref:type II secretion system F family protein n=1 Tax=Parasphingopyxis sp. CP4 TaxID=2724527 RepID=UPI0015A210CD|nr:type II secretion system F family protein [Parasphingopyxis sp. CP4]QLC22442.1 type II secretion system F family protein [Parasphingopyxis sp. CP4]
MTPEILRLFILLLVFVAVLLISERVIAYMRSSSGESRTINKRLKLISKGVSRDEVVARLRRDKPDRNPYLPATISAFSERLERTLGAAGLVYKANAILVALAIAVLTIFLLVMLLLYFLGSDINTGKIFLAGTFAVAVGFGFPLMLFARMADKRKKLLTEQFPVALDVFVRGLRAGHPVAAALELLTTEMSDPIGSEFGIVTDEVTYGADLRDALQDMADRCDLDDMQMFVVSLSIQSETGGNLAEILENLSQVIRERANMMLKVRALSSEGRMTALILTALPIFSFVVLFLANPLFYLDVAEDPMFIPGFAGLLVAFTIGVIWIRRMIDLKV